MSLTSLDPCSSIFKVSNPCSEKFQGAFLLKDAQSIEFSSSRLHVCLPKLHMFAHEQGSGSSNRKIWNGNSRGCGVALEYVLIAAQVLYKKVLYKSWRVRLQSQLHLAGYTPNTYYYSTLRSWGMAQLNSQVTMDR